MRTIFILVSVFIVTGCCNNPDVIDADRAKSDILLAEKEFSEMAADSGIVPAFLHFAANDAVILRGDKIVSGFEGISSYFEDRDFDAVSLVWTPDFVDVSASGDLGYTYGRYVFTLTDSTGQSVSEEGIFHTVWKKQPDGSWKYVWD